MTTIYVDTSAWGKLVKDEPESAEFAAYVDRHLDDDDDFVSSALLITEMGRLAERFSIPRSSVVDAMDQVSLFLPTWATFGDAGRLAGANLRSLDALHLAQCLAIDADILASYDERQCDAAHQLGIRTVSPGAADS